MVKLRLLLLLLVRSDLIPVYIPRYLHCGGHCFIYGVGVGFVQVSVIDCDCVFNISRPKVLYIYDVGVESIQLRWKYWHGVPGSIHVLYIHFFFDHTHHMERREYENLVSSTITNQRMDGRGRPVLSCPYIYGAGEAQPETESSHWRTPQATRANHRHLFPSSFIHPYHEPNKSKPRTKKNPHHPSTHRTEVRERRSYSTLPASLSLSSAQIFSMRRRFSRAFSRLRFARSNRSAPRHLFTSRLMSLQLPRAFQRKPRAWHSSRAVMMASQSITLSPEGGNWIGLVMAVRRWVWEVVVGMVGRGDGVVGGLGWMGREGRRTGIFGGVEVGVHLDCLFFSSPCCCCPLSWRFWRFRTERFDVDWIDRQRIASDVYPDSRWTMLTPDRAR